MKTLVILASLALLAVATPASAETETSTACGWCCDLSAIDYAQCMSTMVYEGSAPGGGAGQVTDGYWDATMNAVDVVQENLPAIQTTRAVAFGCDGRTLQDDAACFAEGAVEPILFCDGTAEGTASCIVAGERANLQEFNDRLCTKFLCPP